MAKTEMEVSLHAQDLPKILFLLSIILLLRAYWSREIEVRSGRSRWWWFKIYKIVQSNTNQKLLGGSVFYYCGHIKYIFVLMWKVYTWDSRPVKSCPQSYAAILVSGWMGCVTPKRGKNSHQPQTAVKLHICYHWKSCTDCTCCLCFEKVGCLWGFPNLLFLTRLTRNLKLERFKFYPPRISYLK